MQTFLIGLFLFVNLAIRVPVKIGLHFSPKNKTLLSIDFWSFIIVCFNLPAILIYWGYINNSDRIISITLLSAFFVGFALLILYYSRKGEKEEQEFRQKNAIKLYEQTNQRPNLDNYGRSIDNPIWTGTPSFYFNHLYTEDGRCATWKFSEQINLETKNGFYNGIFGCKLAKYDVFVDYKYVESFYICTGNGLDTMQTWHAPKGYKFIKNSDEI